MADFAGFNKTISDDDLDTNLEDVMDYKFYGKTFLYENIYELANKKNKTTDGTFGVAQVSGCQVFGAPRDGPVAFGKGSNDNLPFAFSMDAGRYSAAEALTRRTPSLISQAVRKGKRFHSAICSVPSKLCSFPVSCMGFMVPVLGKRQRPAASPVSGSQEHNQASADRAGKRLRDNNGGAVAIAATVHSPVAARTTAGENWEMVGRAPRGLTALNPANTNTNTAWERPHRKEYGGFRGFFQPAEDKSWTVDPRTGRRILKATSARHH
ncbi:uncharacterized protein N0V89_010156 [Didymosphaeria variabile]|uniref:Uncharacterized protein n=1 Tax=Didymosphaeria variabile TaxID=1932322 RepID=A0A9W9C7Z0_9PLEO|nr:uncharacterized protein N0V89_010156 [Didymosphaeria variabile]KAJ4348778.1 hypothetical protein N0V89_010156 [Didymosphaeria variabile]